jgi:hypothetical protein
MPMPTAATRKPRRFMALLPDNCRLGSPRGAFAKHAFSIADCFKRTYLSHFDTHNRVSPQGLSARQGMVNEREITPL